MSQTNTARYEICAKVFKRAQDLKAHKTRQRHHQQKFTKVTGTATKEALKMKLKTAQAELPQAFWDDTPAENCWDFVYLGSMFTPDGSHMPDVRRRIAMAIQRHGKMRHIWKSGHLHLRLKLRLYVAAVCSVMTYGSEAWLLDDATIRALNGANSRMVSTITGRSPHEEAKQDTKTYDLVAGVRARRLKWLGQILTMKQDRMLHKAVKSMYNNRRPGDILMDAPASSNWPELIALAKKDKGAHWKILVRKINDMVYIQAAKGDKKSKSKKTKKRNNKHSTAKKTTSNKGREQRQ